MPRPLTNDELRVRIEGLFGAFGIDLRARMTVCKTFPEAQAAFATAKADAKKEFKRLAMTMHPDRGGDLGAFQDLAGKMNEIEGIGFEPPPPPVPVLPFMVIHMGFGVGGGSATTTQTSGFGFGTIDPFGSGWPGR